MGQRTLLVLSLTVLVVVLVGTACASATATQDLHLASASSLPPNVRNAPLRVREAYQFAAANPDALKNVPCYCGCNAIGHTSNYSCYVHGANPDGSLVFDDHALGCSICVDIAQDVMRLTRAGKQPSEIRQFVISTYSKFGPANQ